MKHREQILENSDEPNLSYKVFHARGLWCTGGRYKVFRQTQTRLRHLYSMKEVHTEDRSLTPWISSSSIINTLPQTNIEIIRFVWTESHPKQQILLCSAQLVVRFIFCCCFFLHMSYGKTQRIFRKIRQKSCVTRPSEQLLRIQSALKPGEMTKEKLPHHLPW